MQIHKLARCLPIRGKETESVPYSTNILAVPFCLLSMLVEAFLLLVAARLLMDRCGGTGQLYLNSCHLTDGVVKFVDRSFARKEWPHPRWLSWTVVITAGILVRQFLVWIIMSM